jgi:hypothetical protein
MRVASFVVNGASAARNAARTTIDSHGLIDACFGAELNISSISDTAAWLSTEFHVVAVAEMIHLMKKRHPISGFPAAATMVSLLLRK